MVTGDGYAAALIVENAYDASARNDLTSFVLNYINAMTTIRLA